MTAPRLRCTIVAMTTPALTQEQEVEQEVEQSRIAEIYKAHTLRTNTLALFTGDAFPPRKKGAEHVPLLAIVKSIHAALTRYEQQRATDVAVYEPLAEVFVQLCDHLAVLVAATLPKE